MQMLMTGEPITAQEAHRLGMVNELHPRAELMDAVLRIAEKIARQLADGGAGGQAGRSNGQGEPSSRPSRS